MSYGKIGLTTVAVSPVKDAVGSLKKRTLPPLEQYIT